MSASVQKIVIKKYANRRLYHTGDSVYVTLDDLADMTRRGEEFVVHDAKTGQDITRSVLAQIIFDAESRGTGLLPIAFLRQLITFYDGQMQALVPTYLEHSLTAFAEEQEKLRKSFNKTLGDQAFDAIQEQVRRNMDLFQRSVSMFVPMPQGASSAPPPAQSSRETTSASDLAEDVKALRGELAAMEQKIAAMSAANGEDTEAEDGTFLPATAPGSSQA